MKSIKFFSILLFPFFAFGMTHTTIVQNVSNSDLLIYYTSCNIFGKIICNPIKTFQLNQKSSNYNNPIIANGNYSPGNYNRISIIKIIDLKNNNSKYFGPYECQTEMNGETNKTNQIDFLTISNLIDNSSVLICTQGSKK